MEVFYQKNQPYSVEDNSLSPYYASFKCFSNFIRTSNQQNNKAYTWWLQVVITYCVYFIVINFTGLQPLLAQAPPSGFASTVVSSQWSEAVGLSFNTDGTQMFVWERGGKVWVVENNQKQLFIDISEEVGGWRDFGLLGFALHPQFATNGYFYLLYTVDRHHLMRFGTSGYSSASNEYFNATIGRLTRYTATKTSTGYTVNPASRKILLGATRSTGIPSLHESHGVGSLVFGSDGTLLVSAGDGASYAVHDGGSAEGTYYAQALSDGIINSQENVGAFRAQLLESYNGKILRIDPETGNGVPGNPFYETANPGSVRSKVWALGFRNPFRMTLKPNSGSTNPGDGKPGVLYVSDVGWGTWEELNVVTKSGMNFGWPIYEGLTQETWYPDIKKYNFYAPNPLYGTGGCTQQYFYFQDLIKQETASGTATFPNPCNTTQSIPPSVNTFVHSRPVIDWNHNSSGPSRTGTFSGETATVTNIGATGSPVSGPQFGGNAAIAGVFYTKNDFPPEFRNSLFFGDYSSGWIRTITTDASEKPVSVSNFINSGAVVVCMATHPTEGGIYYVNFPSEIRKITYRNRAPVAVATADKTYGQSPLTVQFTGSQSYDLDGQNLTYLWNFGNGSTSTAINPSHTFTTSTTAPTTYTVTLTVKDPPGSTNQATLKISVNNTPPQVTITSPAANTLYPINSGDQTYNLQATVTDQEHTSSQLSYEWQTILHHQDHEHPEPIDTSPQTTTTISPLGCGAEVYYYRIKLTVTDAGGLSTTKEVILNPDCGTSTSTQIVREYWGNISGDLVASIPVNTPPTSTMQLTSFEEPSNVADNYGTRIRAFVHPPASGDYVFWIASDNDSELWLSTDENPANKRRIAFVSGWTYDREWGKFTSQKSAIIALQAGKKYYIESLHKEGAGGDNLAVGWTLPDGSLERPIPGIRLTPFSGTSPTTPTPNQPPTVAINSPDNNATFTAPATITINATASDADGSVAKVEFYNGTVKLGEDLTSPYTYTWSSVAKGNYTLTAKAVDNAGAVTTSAAVNVTVSDATSTPPTVAITSPANNSTFTAPATITISANATDADGIRVVEFFNGSNKLGEDLVGPYSFSWSNVPAGSYQLIARATDNVGSASLSAAVTVQVNSTTSGCTATGEILREVWSGVKGTSVAAIPVTSPPSSTLRLNAIEVPINAGNNYGQRVRGYICAPSTGDYVFYIASDESSELWLSSDENPANKQRIAFVNGVTQIREWTKFTSQKSALISLEAGKRYYIEALHKEDKGGDHMAVGWQLPSTTVISVIGREYISPFTVGTSAVSAMGSTSYKASKLTGKSIAFEVYPNPPQGNELHIKASGMAINESYELILYSNLGKETAKYTGTTDDKGKVQTQVRLPQQLSIGVYILVLQSRSQELRQKVVIIQ